MEIFGRVEKLNVKELIKKLELIEDKSLQVRISISTLENEYNDYENYFLQNIDEYSTNSSGYENNGEVVLRD